MEKYHFNQSCIPLQLQCFSGNMQLLFGIFYVRPFVPFYLHPFLPSLLSCFLVSFLRCFARPFFPYYVLFRYLYIQERIINSSSSGLRPRTLPLGHGGSPQYWIFTSELRRNICFFESWMPERGDKFASPDFPGRLMSFNHYNMVPALQKQNFHSLEAVDRVSETQLQVGENWGALVLAFHVPT